jgi:arylsulfatase A-like enzyme
MGAEWGYDRGFDQYFETFSDDKPGYTSADFLRKLLSDSQLRRPLFNDFLRTLRDGPDSMTSFKFDLLLETVETELSPPFLGMMNTTIVHSPYDPPRPFKENATPELQRSRWYILEYLLDTVETINRDDVRTDRIYNAQTTDGIARFLADPEYLTASELDVLRAWYRASIEYLDTQLSSFVTQLEKKGYLDNTILVLTSDHGEHFGEHGLIAHSHFLYEESLHVPLIITGPGVPSTRRSDLVSLVDLFDTVCDLTSVSPPDETSGISVFDGSERSAVYSEYGIRHRNPEGHRKYMSEEQLEAFGVGRKCIRTENYRYEYTSAGNETLYSRPGEREIDDPSEEILTDHRDKLFQTLGSEFETTHGNDDISGDIEDNLRKLGYID